MKKQIKLDTSKQLLNLKESFSKIIDKEISKKKLQERFSSIDCLNIGQIKQLFESISVDLYNSEKGKTIIKDYVKTIKENKSLKDCYTLYENLNKFTTETNNAVIIPLLENISNSINVEKLCQGEKYLTKILKEGCLSVCFDVDKFNDTINKNSDLNESFDKLIKGNTNSKSLLERSEAFSKVINYINENKSVSKGGVETKTKNEFLEGVEDILKENLEPWEKDVIRDVSLNKISGKDNQVLFEEYKQKCIDTIDGLIKSDNIEEYNRFSLMKEQISGKQYDSEKFNDDIFMLSELHYTLNDVRNDK